MKLKSHKLKANDLKMNLLFNIKSIMHSNEQSPRQDLNNREAVAKLKELAENAGTCMICTKLSQFPHVSKPKALQEVDETGKLWFII